MTCGLVYGRKCFRWPQLADQQQSSLPDCESVVSFPAIRTVGGALTNIAGRRCDRSLGLLFDAVLVRLRSVLRQNLPAGW